MSALFRFCDHTLSDGDRLEILTPAEAAHLGIMAQHPGRVIQAETMEANRWPEGVEPPKEPHKQVTLEISLLQAKLEPFGLRAVNVYDVGYYLQGEMDVDWGAI